MGDAGLIPTKRDGTRHRITDCEHRTGRREEMREEGVKGEGEVNGKTDRKRKNELSARRMTLLR